MLNPYLEYPFKYGTPDLIWLWGSPQDITVSGDGKGSPWRASTYKDLLAPWHLMMIRANRVPDENPDTPAACQAYEAMSDVFRVRTYHEDNNNYIGNRDIGSDGIMYECMIDNGPDILPANPTVDPVGDATGTWLYANRGVVGSDLILDIEPDPTFLIQMAAISKEGQSLLDADYPELLAFYNSTAVGGPKPFGSADVDHFYLPSDGGLFIRQWDNGALVDPDRLTRAPRADGIGGDNPSTTQEDAFQGFSTQMNSVDNVPVGGGVFSALSTNAFGAPSGTSISVGFVSDGVNGTPRVAAESRGKNTYKWIGVIAR